MRGPKEEGAERECSGKYTVDIDDVGVSSDEDGSQSTEGEVAGFQVDCAAGWAIEPFIGLYCIVWRVVP